MNILLVTNNAYMHYTKLLMVSLFRQHPNTAVDVYLFHQDLTNASLQELALLTAEYPDKQFIPMRLTAEHTAGLKPSEKLPIETYFRILALELLPEDIDRILYLDVDIIIKKPLTELYHMDFQGQAAVACFDISGYMYNLSQKSEQRLNLKYHEQYFNAGVMLFHLSWFREHDYAKTILDYIFANSDKLLWEDQDALNATLEGKVLLAPWYLYNCTPVSMICRREDVTNGIIRPLYRNEISTVDEAPELYLDMTQAIYGEAHIIHYIGETKPDYAARPPASCFHIFDQAFFATQQFLPKQTPVGRLIIMVGVYDILDIFSYELVREFRQMNYEVLVFDSRDMQYSLTKLSEFIKQPVTAVITFNNLGFNMELVPGKNIWDELGIICVNILMDHPYCHKAALDAAPANAAVLCPDRNHMRYVQRFYPNIPITGFLPHAGKKLRLEPKPISERSMDVFYAGSLSRKYAHDIIPDFSQYDFDAKGIADRAYQDLITHPHKTAEDAIESALLEADIHLSETDLCDFIESIHYIDMLATSHFREATVRTLVENGIDVYLCGSGWDVCTWLSNPHLHNLGRISADEVVRQMGDAKIVLSTMTWFKDGTHDRVFNGMLAGAVAVSDSSIYMKEEFCGDPKNPDAELILFELEQISQLPQMLRTLLSSPARMQQIADKGRSRALAEHTWKHRAEELHQDLLQTL